MPRTPQEEQDQLLMISTVLFAVRVFRGTDTSNTSRAIYADMSTLDAKALIEAAKKAKLT